MCNRYLDCQYCGNWYHCFQYKIDKQYRDKEYCKEKYSCQDAMRCYRRGECESISSNMVPYL